MERRRPIDLAPYVERSRDGPCFICELVAGRPLHPQHVVYDGFDGIAFLSIFQPLLGYTIVAPREHREHVTGDFTVDEYLELQRLVHRVGEAVRRAVPTERLYVLSLGSQSGNRHVHWHVAPLPPGVPYEEQQLEALGLERGVLDLPEERLAELAASIRGHLESSP